MTKNTGQFILFFVGITAALSFSGILISTGISFAEWNDTQKIGYFIDVHARLLVYAGIAINLLGFTLGFALIVAFARIRQLEALVKKPA